MTPKEKWDRIHCPTQLADFSLRLSDEELATFPEGRALLLAAEFGRPAAIEIKAEFLQDAVQAVADQIDRDILALFNEGGEEVQGKDASREQD
jgi:hypothetical protein